MKIKHRIRLWAGLFLLLATGSLFFFFLKTVWADPVGFSVNDLQKINSGSGSFEFVPPTSGQKPFQKIKATFPLGSGTRTIYFTKLTSQDPQINFTYQYINQGDFCAPFSDHQSNAPYYSFDRSRGPESKLAVKFKDVSNKPDAEVVESGSMDSLTTIYSSLWPGKASTVGTNGLPMCGNIENPSVNPDHPPGYIYGPISLKNGHKVTSPSLTGAGTDYTDNTVNHATFKYTEGGVVRMTFDPNVKSFITNQPPNPVTIDFADSNPQDATYNLVAAKRFCTTGQGAKNAEINLDNTNTGATLSDNPIKAKLKISYYTTAGCEDHVIAINIANPNATISSGTSTIAQSIFRWNFDTGSNEAYIEAVGCSLSDTVGSCSGVNWTLRRLQQSGNVTKYVKHLTGQPSDIVILDAEGANTGKYSCPQGSCGPNSKPTSNTRDVAIIGTFGQPPPSGGGGGGLVCDNGQPPQSDGTCADGSTPHPQGNTNSQDDEAVCEQRSAGFAEHWLLCPILSAANSTAQGLTSLFESQLAFTLTDPAAANSTGSSAVSSEGLVNLKKAWTAIRIIASALIIILMLVMVLSEAIGGPFDAYTVRKVLPRIVLVVILMQISWGMFIWVINAVDHLGRDVANIMYWPWGGTSSMDLNHLMNAAHLTTGGGEAGVITFSFIAVIGVVIAAAAALPFVLAAVFMAILALLTGLLVLLLRKVIIIMALVFAPIALLMWVLPGTQRYWKLWWDNFIKMLFMFPLIIAIIAAGRIFARTAAFEHNGSLLNFIIVLVGFFGPLFILPKTYKWGGQLMNATGNITSKATAGAYKPLGDYMTWRKGVSRWSMARKNRRAVKEQLFGRKFASTMDKENLRGPLRGFRAGFNKSRLLGVGTPKGEADVITRVSRLAKAQAAKAEQEDIEGYFTALGHDIDGKDLPDALKILTDKFKSSKSPEERKAILKRVAQYKGSGVKTLKDLRKHVGGQEWSTYANGYMYGDFKELDRQLLQGDDSVPSVGKGPFFDERGNLGVGDEGLAGQTEAGWRDAMEEAQARGPAQVQALQEAYSRILASADSGKLDAGGRSFMEGRSGVIVPPLPAPAAPPTPRRPGVPVPSPGTREEWFANSSDYEIDRFVHDPATGGYTGLSNDDLVHIFNHRSGSAKTAAEAEIATRRAAGTMP